MLVFMDESGDTGFKLGAGSSGEFTITLLVFADHEEAEAASRRIDRLRADLPLSDIHQEFHFSQNSNEQRKAFLEAVSGFAFLTFAIVVNKAKLGAEGVTRKIDFYNRICGLVFSIARDHLKEANVTLDSTGDQAFKKQLASYLKNLVNTPEEGGQRIKNVGMKPSHSDNLLQMVDMICGAIARSYHQDKRQSDSFRQIIKHRIVSVLVWPQ